MIKFHSQALLIFFSFEVRGGSGGAFIEKSLGVAEIFLLFIVEEKRYIRGFPDFHLFILAI